MGLFRSVFLFFVVVQSCFAAPLVAEVEENHWAQDAIKLLSSKGLVEGYSRGDFRGARSASRWELASLVARLAERNARANSGLLNKEERELLGKLVELYSSELSTLGLRVENLRTEMELVEERVSELEKIEFYGNLKVKVGAQDFGNRDSVGLGPNREFIDFQQAVGSSSGAGGPLPANTLFPGIWGLTTHGTLPVSDFEQGRPLVSGTLFTALATLGLKTKLNENLSAGLELKAYASMGNSVVDALHGVTPPYLSNPFAATPNANNPGAQALNNLPFTRVTLDNFWLKSEKMNTLFRFGSFQKTNFGASIYQAPRLPNQFHFTTPFLSDEDSADLGSFGIQVQGEVPLNDSTKLIWEGIYTRLPDGNIDPLGSPSYSSHAEGANLALSFHEQRGLLKFNFLHAANEDSGGRARAVGSVFEPVLGLQWVNPDGFFLNQLAGDPSQIAGIGSSGDGRPVPGFALLGLDGNTGAAGIPNFGGIGPQAQNTYGLSFDYRFEHTIKPHVFFEYARSDYRPSRNSRFRVNGEAFRAGFDLHFLNDGINWQAEYVSTDPTFSPFVLQYPRVGGIPVSSPYFDDFPSLYSLHNVGIFQNNRRGFRTNLDFNLSLNTQFGASYGRLTQVSSSAPDIRFSAGSLGLSIPNSDVLGFTPGTRESFYGALSPHTFVADSGGNSLGLALENPKGVSTEFSVYGYHKWKFKPESERGLSLSGIYFNYGFLRESSLASLRGGGRGTQGESENFHALTADGFLVRLDYDVTEDFSAHASFTEITAFGHYDPTGVYSSFAESTGSTRFANIDNTQTIPELGFDWQVHEKMKWSVMGRHITNRDGIPAHTFVSVGDPTQNVRFAPTVGAHPFDWSGWQLHSTFSLEF